MSNVVAKKVTVESRTKALMGNYKRCTVKDVHPHIKYVMTEDVGVWYFIMGVGLDGVGEFCGNDNEFVGGQFIGKITATKNYPYEPPDVEMLTPTMIFPLNTSEFCTDIGKFHKNEYPASLGMDGFVKMIWSGMVGWREIGHGINLMVCKPHDKYMEKIKAASVESRDYNIKHNSKIIDLLTE